jgi:hypothetical protein
MRARRSCFAAAIENCNVWAVTVLHDRKRGVAVKHQPVVFDYRRWLNADNMVVALKPTATREQPSGSIISKLLKP